MSNLLKRTIYVPFTIEGKFINDVMSSALCGGIEYWCSLVNAKDMDMKGCKYLSDLISNGGVLELTDDSDQIHLLDFTKFCLGFEKYIKWCVRHNRKFYLSSEEIDSEEADIIVQFAIFGEIVYS